MKNVDADFISAGRGDLDVFELERLASSPADGGLALDDFPSGGGHDSSGERDGQRMACGDALCWSYKDGSPNLPVS